MTGDGEGRSTLDCGTDVSRAPGSVALELAPAGPADDPPTPPGIARVRAFVNTREIDGETSVEGFETPADLAAWLAAHELVPDGTSADGDDLREAIVVREALRDLLESNAGHGVHAEALRVLGDAASRSPLAVRFDRAGDASLAPVGDGPRAALGRMFADVATAVADGTWARLKVCRNDECRWAYYDVSRNRSGRWCSMAGCGNRMKGRAYRSRTRPGGSAGRSVTG
jgi:predicted RNA-binding Zn ribbon-like protein